jgi:patatin-like phospholipase/acyl hydrolase
MLTCLSFVLTVDSANLNNKKAVCLRTYINDKVPDSLCNYKIWEAARATTAAPTYFPRMKLDDYEYIDGGVGFNNPVLLYVMSFCLWPA